MPLLAKIHEATRGYDERAAARRTLRLRVPTDLATDGAEALIHNLSERGLLIETTTTLALDETLRVELPEAGSTVARVVWIKDDFAGCEFVLPVSKAAVSAALLLSPAEGARLARPALLPSASAFEPAPHEYEDGSSSRTPVMVALVISLLIATAFIVALLTFPFSN